MATDNFARILALKAKSASETVTYSSLPDKPTINNVTINGDLSLEDLGITEIWVGTYNEYLEVASTLTDGTLVIITDDDTIDSVPTQNSTNLVTSGGVYAFVVNNTLPASTKYAANATFSMNGNSFVCTLTLKDQNGDTIGTPQSIDLPLETMVIGGSYNDTTKSIVLTLKSGDTLNIPVGDLVRGLQTEITVENKLNADLVDDTTAINKFVTAAQKTKIGEIDDKYPKAWDIELTQAQYDALPNTKYRDGKNYYITDSDVDETIVYGFHVDPDESDPFDAVTYVADAIGMEPAAMGSTAFNYGSWKNAFFMPKPCMLKYDGTVDYYLDPNDYTKKTDGTPSDISDPNYGGNAMMEWGLIWYKFVAGTAEGEGYFYVSNQQVDDDYKCWNNYDADGNIVPHFYTAIYDSTMPDGLSDRMRSLSGLRLTPTINAFAEYDNTATYDVGALCKVDSTAYTCITAVTTAEEFDSDKWQEITPNNSAGTTGQELVDGAVANNTTGKTEWYIEVWCDRLLITSLLYLMGKSLDLQNTYGIGMAGGSSGQLKEQYVTGAGNDKGLFYGSLTNNTSFVKVFGMENPWACVAHRTAGLVRNSTGFGYKLTYSNADGTTVTSYNDVGTGYLATAFERPASGWITKMRFSEHGILPIDTQSGSSSTYYCDYIDSGFQNTYATIGSYSGGNSQGAFYMNFIGTFADRGQRASSNLSCKPLASHFEEV